MSIIERTLELARNPSVSREFLEERQKQQNRLAADFVRREINLETLRRGLSEFRPDEDSCIILPSPGPLYGLLRKIGVEKAAARARTDEERVHYLAAKNHHVEKTKIIIEFGKGGQITPNGIRSHFYSVFFYYEIPPGIDEETARAIIKDISLAPKNPSSDDQAKLA